jgi:hypothetical protein
VKDAKDIAEGETIQFFDSNTGKVLFEAPKERSMADFLSESRAHGWPSFRDAEVNWEYVRCLPGGYVLVFSVSECGVIALGSIC